MPRPHRLRHIMKEPGATYFKPAGIPMRMLEEVIVSLDEFEALRLADHEGLYQEQGAERMKVSRPTFARVLASARGKVADALVHGKALRLEGGPVVTAEQGMGCGRRGFGCGRGFGRNNMNQNGEEQ